MKLSKRATSLIIASLMSISSFSPWTVLSEDIPSEPTPTMESTPEPTVIPTDEPTVEPTIEPTVEPTVEPTAVPTIVPTPEPTAEPTVEPTDEPILAPMDANDTEDEIETTTVTAYIWWYDSSYSNQYRPESVDLKLNYGDDDNLITASSQTTNNSTTTFVFENVPVEYNGTTITTYSFDSSDLPYYYAVENVSRSSGNRYYLSTVLQGIQYSIIFNLNSSSAINDIKMFDGKTPVTATIKRDGETIRTVTFEPNSYNSWNTIRYSDIFFELAVDEEGNKLYPDAVYTVEWSSPFYGILSLDITESTNFYSISSYNYARLNSTLTINMPYITMVSSTGSYYTSQSTVTLTEADDSNALPDTLELQLLMDGEPVDVPLSYIYDANGTPRFEYNWGTLPINHPETGEPINYSVNIVNLPAYYTATDQLNVVKPSSNDPNYNLGHMDFTFSLIEPQSFTANVVYQGDGIGSEEELKERPVNEIIELQYTTDNGQTWNSFWGTSLYGVSPNGTNTYSYTWDNLPSIDPEGNPVKYRVRPAEGLALYTTETDDPVYTTNESGKVTSTTQTIHHSYNDNWNYTIDLHWEYTDPAEKYDINRVTTDYAARYMPKYMLSLSTQKAYEIGMLEIRIPRELFNSLNNSGNTGTLPSQIALGTETSPNSDYAFVYRIDTKDTVDTSDDEIVFYNYEPISAGHNIQIPVMYDFYARNVTDCEVGTLTATVTGQYVGQDAPETQTSQTITFRVDTGARFTSNGTKGVWQPVHYWNDVWGEEPTDFDEYNYVFFSIYAPTSVGNQKLRVDYTERPGDGGIMVGLWSTTPNWGDRYRYAYTDNGDGTYSWSTNRGIGSGTYSDSTYYALIKYPRDPERETALINGTVYTDTYPNEVDFDLFTTDEHEDDKGPNDQNDVDHRTIEFEYKWSDYVFSYNGEIYIISKTRRSEFGSGAMNLIESGFDANDSYSVETTVNGYNFANGYRVSTVDDKFYVAANQGISTGYYKMTDEDYEISNVGYYILHRETDRTNGREYYARTDQPFKIYGRLENSDEWEFIEDVYMSTSENDYYIGQGTISTDISGRGYTAVKIESPEGLDDHFRIQLHPYMTVKADSPLIQSLMEQGATELKYANFAYSEIYVKNDDETETLFNQNSGSFILDYDSNYNLDLFNSVLEEDQNEFGRYVDRYAAFDYMRYVTPTSSMRKQSAIQINNAQETISAYYYLEAYEQMPTTLLPEEAYIEHSADEAVFYDLLPEGYRFDQTKAVVASGGAERPFGSNRDLYYGSTEYLNTSYPASVDRIETIDNYQGTGRQLVKFYVSSLLEDNANWRTSSYSSYYPNTGFRIYFYATASFSDVPNGVSQRNIAAYQRTDGEELWGGYSDYGYPTTSENNYSYYRTIYIDGEDGNPVFYDLDENGVIENRTTQYNYTSQTANFIVPIENGISKQVLANTGYYTLNDTVDIDTDYSYKISLTTDKNAQTKDVILYDILENATNVEGNTNETGWQGTLLGVRTTAAEKLGIDVVVWYCTSPISYNEMDATGDGQTRYLPEEHLDKWSTTAPDDLSTVTALAFDLRTLQTGEENIFDADTTVSVEILMHSPSELQENAEYAYNRPSYNSSSKPLGSSEWKERLNIGSRTTLLLRDLQEITFKKVFLADDDKTIKPLGGVRFGLYQCTETDEDHEHYGTPGSTNTCWGSTSIQTAVSDSNGIVTFHDLDTGIYAVRELVARQGFNNLSYRYWIYEVDASQGTVSAPTAVTSYVSTGTSNPYPPVEMEYEEENELYTLSNPRITMTFRMTKQWQDDSDRILRPTEITFDLYRNDVLYKTETFTVTRYNSNYYFYNLPIYDEYGRKFYYEVKERAVEGYESTINIAGPSVTPDYNSSIQRTFTNTRLGTLEIRKNTDGEFSEDQVFAFTISLTDADDQPLPTTDEDDNPISYTLRRYTSFTATEYTTETVTLNDDSTLSVTLAKDEKVLLIGLPIGAKYSVSEDAGNYVGSVTEGSDTGTLSSTTNPSVTFTNKPVTAKLSLPVQKTITGEETPTDKTFTFTLTGTNNAPMPATGGETVTITGEGTDSFGEITFNKPGTYTYQVTETQDNETGYTYDSAKTVVVTVSGTSSYTVSYTVNGLEANQVLFTNQYNPTSTAVQLPISKSINGTVYGEAKTFTFTLSGLNNAPMPENTTATITGNGTATFDAITFTSAGTYTYTITEQAVSNDGYTYDATSYQAVITVTDTDGELSATWTMNGTARGTASFANTVNNHETGVGSFTVKKVREGNTDILVPGAVFVLKDGDQTIATATTNTDGIATFSINLTGIGPITYTLSERSAPAGYTATEDTWNVTFTRGETESVTLNADENRFDVVWNWSTEITGDNGSYQDGMLTVTNEYNASGEVQLAGTKELTGRDLVDQEFSFTVMEGNDVVARGKNNTNNGIDFSVIEYGIDDVGTHTYVITEDKGTAGGVDYSTQSFTVTVEVTDNKDGTLTAIPTYPEGGVAFTNVYTAKGEITLEGTKDLIGRDLNNEEFSFTVKEGNNTVATGKNTIDGLITFSTINYTQENLGTHTYVITEDKGSAGGIDYSTQSFTVLVTVDDNKDGSLAIDVSYPEGGVAFTNHYDTENTAVKLRGMKELVGRSLNDAEFSFTVKEDDTIVATGTNNTDGTIDFEEITYTLDDVGTHTYVITEDAGNLGGITYSTASFTVTVEVSDLGDGTLSAIPTYPDTGIVFENNYTPTSTSVSLEADKRLTGTDLKADQFSFELLDDQDQVIMTVRNDANGHIAFNDLVFDQVGIYTYTIREVNDQQASIKYDDSVYTVTIEVRDDGQGALVAEWKEADQKITFTNTYVPPTPDTPVPNTSDPSGILQWCAIAIIALCLGMYSVLQLKH